MFDKPFHTSALAGALVCFVLLAPSALWSQDEPVRRTDTSEAEIAELEVTELQREVSQLREQIGELLREHGQRQQLEVREEVERRRERRQREERGPEEIDHERTRHVREAIAHLMEAGWQDEAQRLYRRLERPNEPPVPSPPTDAPGVLPRPWLPPEHVQRAIEHLNQSVRHIEEQLRNSEQLAEAARQANVHVEELRRQFETHSRGLEDQLRQQLRSIEQHATEQIEDMQRHVGRIASDVSHRLEQFEREQARLRDELNDEDEDEDEDD